MTLSRVFLAGCLLVGVTGSNTAFAQFGIPRLPGSRGGKDDSRSRRQRQQRDDGGQANAPGVPIPPDSPIFESFRKLGQQSVYHQKMTITATDPRISDVMAQMGFAPAETITAGDTKQVSMHLKMPALGQVEDFELRSVSRNGRLAKKWSSPGSARILKEQDASIATQLAQAEAQYAGSIAKDLATGPFGIASAAVDAAGAAASAAVAARLSKQAHDFFEWTCMDGGPQTSHDRSEPPPLTDLKVVGDSTVEGVAVTGYEFYVHENGKAQGPMQMFVAKDSGLPVRIGMNDPRGQGGMTMDYFGFNQGGDFEIPACLDKK
jgi:hypothetical protein